MANWNDKPGWTELTSIMLEQATRKVGLTAEQFNMVMHDLQFLYNNLGLANIEIGTISVTYAAPGSDFDVDITHREVIYADGVETIGLYEVGDKIDYLDFAFTVASPQIGATASATLAENAETNPNVTVETQSKLNNKGYDFTFTFTIPRGSTGVSFRSRGEYDADETYCNDDSYIDAVSYEGSLYVAKQETTGNLPTNTTYWDKVVSKGDKGDIGNTGVTPNITIGTITTGESGSSASASITGTAENPILSFTIPRGNIGETGATGETGETGLTGVTPNITINVQSVAAENNASVVKSGTAENPIFTISLPRGSAGTNATAAGMRNIEISSSDWILNNDTGLYEFEISSATHGLGSTQALMVFTMPYIADNSLSMEHTYDSPIVDGNGNIKITSTINWSGLVLVAGGISEDVSQSITTINNDIVAIKTAYTKTLISTDWINSSNISIGKYSTVINASTHNKGITPKVDIYDSDGMKLDADISIDGSGNVTYYSNSKTTDKVVVKY